MIEIVHSECLEYMKTLPDNSIDAIVTDPPYGLSFMSKKWDRNVPSMEYWKECYRLAKPGTFLLAAGAPRSHHHLAIAIEDAGWEITDCIMHIFGSGFPKGKSQLKPAYEPWILARKKSSKCKHLNIDNCRIPTNDKLSGGACNGSQNHNPGWDRPWRYDKEAVIKFSERCKESVKKSEELGRWPANVIFDEVAAEILDEQSGISKSIPHQNKPKNSISSFCKSIGEANSSYQDFGGASRFFYCAKASSSERNEGLEGMPIKQTVGGGGLTNVGDKFGSIKAPAQNYHPTVKPLKLMQYLIKLIMPPNLEAVLLDPFAGSGSTLVAAKTLGIKNAIGIEMEQEYVDIARKRVEHAKIKQEQLVMNL